MHTITVTFEDKEFEDLKEEKGKTPWHNFILENMKKAKAYDEERMAMKAL